MIKVCNDIKIVTIQRQTLEMYRVFGTIKNLPDSIDGITVAYDSYGKIIDWEAYDSEDNELGFAFAYYEDLKFIMEDAYTKAVEEKIVGGIGSLYTY